MLYKATLWVDGDFPNDQNQTLSLDAIKDLVKNFKPCPVFMRNFEIPVGGVTSLELNAEQTNLQVGGIINLDDSIGEKISSYDIYPVTTSRLEKNTANVEHLGFSVFISHVTLQAVQPNPLIPPIEKLTD